MSISSQSSKTGIGYNVPVVLRKGYGAMPIPMHVPMPVAIPVVTGGYKNRKSMKSMKSMKPRKTRKTIKTRKTRKTRKV
jgi:hypothetical protein